MSSKSGTEAIAMAFASAFEAVENSAGNIVQVCSVARATYRGEPVPRLDADTIVDEITKRRKWEGDTAKVRRSEVRRVLSVYASLGEAITIVRTRAGSCDWRAALRLATILRRNGGRVRPAVAEFSTQETKRVMPRTRAAGALKAWYRRAKGEQRAAILKAAELLGVDLGLEPVSVPRLPPAVRSATSAAMRH